METKIFILCAGRLEKFNGITRQLLRIGHETIIGRTIRLLCEECKHKIYIVTRNELIEYYINLLDINKQVELFRPYGNETHKYHMETLFSTKKEWTDRNIFLYGDVVFSREAIRKILHSENKITFFIRIRPHLYVNKRYNEQFGMLIPKEEIQTIKNIIEKFYENEPDVVVRSAILHKIYEHYGITIYNEYLNFDSYKSRGFISKLLVNEYIRGIFYSMIRPFEGKIIRYIYYKANLKEKWKNRLIKLLLGKKTPDYNKNISRSNHVVEIHDISDDIDSPQEYKDYIRLIVKKGLLK